MTIPKRMRFEVLRRDGFTCRYCGASAPDAVLHVDHVLPVALGGDTTPANLVTACEPCNTGKASSSPDAEIVADVDDLALRYARALHIAQDRHRQQLDDLVDQVLTWGDSITTIIPGDTRPVDWPFTIVTFMEHGLNDADLGYYAALTSTRRLPDHRLWSYFCGCCWNVIRQRQDEARRLIERGEI